MILSSTFLLVFKASSYMLNQKSRLTCLSGDYAFDPLLSAQHMDIKQELSDFGYAKLFLVFITGVETQGDGLLGRGGSIIIY
jgi:hypothetical protein